MVPNDAVINALRQLNFSFKLQTDRVHIYKQNGGTARVALRKHKQHDEAYVRILLTQAGMPADEIEVFIAQTRCH